MTVSVPLGVENDRRRPCWWPDAMRGNLHAVSVRCGNGHIATLVVNATDGGGHVVASDGVVTPSVVCPHDGCDWHVTAILEGWK